MKYCARELARSSFLLDVPFDSVDIHPLSGSASRLLKWGESDMGYIGDAVCTIGAFDGVHRGHRYLFAATIGDARRRGLPSVIVTFDPDPDELFLPSEKVHKLLDNEDRLNYLTRFGADFVLSIPFTPELASNDAEGFLKKYLFPVFSPKAIHVGSDFRLGANNKGNVAELRQLGSRRGRSWEVFGYDLLCNRSTPVSATKIRRLLMEEGDCRGAAELLQRCHFVRGQVSKGRQKGREFGFPTANVELSYPYVLPAEGVYACLVKLEDMAWPAAVNVGVPRTFSCEDNCGSVEAHMLGFDGDIYGREVDVAFVERLRGQRQFDSLEELMATVQDNIAWVAQNIGSCGIRL